MSWVHCSLLYTVLIYREVAHNGSTSRYIRAVGGGGKFQDVTDNREISAKVGWPACDRLYSTAGDGAAARPLHYLARSSPGSPPPPPAPAAGSGVVYCIKPKTPRRVSVCKIFMSRLLAVPCPSDIAPVLLALRPVRKVKKRYAKDHSLGYSM